MINTSVDIATEYASLYTFKCIFVQFAHITEMIIQFQIFHSENHQIHFFILVTPLYIYIYILYKRNPTIQFVHGRSNKYHCFGKQSQIFVFFLRRGNIFAFVLYRVRFNAISDPRN